MSDKKKRGVSKCKKKFLHPDESKVEFDAKGRAIGKNAGRFMSWIGVEFKKRIPYNKVARHVNPKEFEDIWEYAKETWKIRNDNGKKVTLTKGKTIMRNFLYTLRKKYVYKDESSDKDKDKDKDKTLVIDEGTSPFEDYDYLDTRLWESFIAVVDDKDWEETR